MSSLFARIGPRPVELPFGSSWTPLDPCDSAFSCAGRAPFWSFAGDEITAGAEGGCFAGR